MFFKKHNKTEKELSELLESVARSNRILQESNQKTIYDLEKTNSKLIDDLKSVRHSLDTISHRYQALITFASIRDEKIRKLVEEAEYHQIDVADWIPLAVKRDSKLHKKKE